MADKRSEESAKKVLFDKNIFLGRKHRENEKKLSNFQLFLLFDGEYKFRYHKRKYLFYVCI